MKILTRYTISSILKIAVVTILLFALILAAVELFSKMDQIMHGGVETVKLIEYIILSLPEYFMMVASISFLFAVTYFLSTLTANNEMIPILNAGVSPVRLRLPIIILAIVLTALGSLFQEHTVIAATNRHDELETELFGASSTRDSRNIVLTDDDGFLIYTQRFSEQTGEMGERSGQCISLAVKAGCFLFRKIIRCVGCFLSSSADLVLQSGGAVIILALHSEECSADDDPDSQEDPGLWAHR